MAAIVDDIDARIIAALIKDARLRHRLEAAKCALPSRDQLVGVIRGWEQEWRSNPKTGLAPSTRNPNLRR